MNLLMNLAVHSREGEIKHGGNINSYYGDLHDATRRFDFVLANPPFNVNAVDTAMRVSVWLMKSSKSGRNPRSRRPELL